MADDGEEMLSVADAARALKVSRVTIHRWLKHGRLPAYHVGPRVVRIRRRDLDWVIVPRQHEGETSMGERTSLSPADGIVLRPLTQAERQRSLAALADARKLGEEILAERGGVPLDESWPLIRQARDERAEQL